MAYHHSRSFKAEYAKSNRSSCKECGALITKDSLRLAIMVQSSKFDGKMPNWYHFDCFWDRAKVSATKYIQGFDSLRWEDQQKITEKVAGSGGKGGGCGDGEEKDEDEEHEEDNDDTGDEGNDATDGAAISDYKNFKAEYAKSGKSTCRGCKEKISKDLMRIASIDHESGTSKRYGPQDRWYHVDCFVENREQLEFTESMGPTKMAGYDNLQPEDMDILIEKFGKGEKRKRVKGNDMEADLKKAKTKENCEEKSLREQSQLIWSFRDKLSNEVSINVLKALLEYNNQKLASGESNLLDRVSDCMVFGALKPCEECEGQLVYRGEGYRCTGNATEWTKCQNSTRIPERKQFNIPEKHNDVDMLKNYKYVKRDRLFPAQKTTCKSGSAGSSRNGETSSGSKPLAGMTFILLGKLSKTNPDLSKSITAFGGRLIKKLDKMTTACIGTEDDVKNMSDVVKDAKAAGVHVVKEEFVQAAKNGGAALLITSHSICDWGNDPHDRIADVPDVPLKKAKSKSTHAGPGKSDSAFTKPMTAKLKMKLKGGAAVDPDSGLADSAHVLQKNDDIYDAVLGLVDLVSGTNSYYKLQLLESDTNKSWWVFRSWGRVGTIIGGNKVELGKSMNSSLSMFKKLYSEKTGNKWDDRKSFVKHPNKFFPLEIDYGTDEESLKSLGSDAGSKSNLPQSVQDLIKMMFDVESMTKVMLEFEIDLKKMPLGKLSKRQIESAYKVLNELLVLVTSGGTATKLLDASNRFYTLIPHDFGMRKPPLLDTEDVIKSKTQMLDNLLEIEVAYSMLKTGDDGGQDPLDVHYTQLKTDIKEMDKNSEEYERLLDYVKNTHASSHRGYDLNVKEIWKVAREGESERHKPFRDLPNRMLLWHGSRNTNYAGIFSQGLRIAPPEAPVTGYMFGKGVYFADMVSKSANYCRTSRSDPTGLMLLCEVALGNMHELKGAQYITKLPEGKHSTKGCGMTEPDPSKTIVADGVSIPIGEGVPATCGYSSLLYNEYIVYDVEQIEIKYLLKMDFNFN